MAFQRYIKSGYHLHPTASIWQRGQIGFNLASVHHCKIADYKFAILFFDADTRRIGIKLSNDVNEAGTRTLTMGKTGGAILSAKSFLDYCGVEYDGKARKYPLEYDKEEELFIIQLKNL